MHFLWFCIEFKIIYPEVCENGLVNNRNKTKHVSFMIWFDMVHSAINISISQVLSQNKQCSSFFESHTSLIYICHAVKDRYYEKMLLSKYFEMIDHINLFH